MPELPPADRHLPEVSRQRWPLSENGRALHAAAPPSREFGLKDLFAVVRRHVPLVLAITGVFLLAAILIALREQPTYTSAAVVRLAEDRHTVTTGDQELVLDDERAKIANPIQTQLELLQSRSVVGPVVESEGLRVRWQSDSLSGAKAPVVRLRSDTAADTVFVTFRPKDVVAQGLKARARAAYGDTVRLGDIGLLAHARPAGVDTATLVVLSEQDAVDALMLQLHVNLRPHTDVIDITYSDPDAHRAQRVVNKLADVFQTRNAYDAQRVARLRRQLLEREIRENDSLLANAESALIAFRTRSRLFSSHQELGELQHDLLQSDMQYEQLKSERDVYASLLDRVDRDASKGTPGGGIHAFLLPQVITQNPAVEPTFRELQRYESSRDSLTTGQWRAAATNPDVLRLDSLIVLTKAKLEGAVRSHVAMLDAQLGAFRRFRARYGSAMNDLPALEAEEQRLLPRAEMLRDAGQKLREQLQQAQMEETVETGDVEIVDRATLPIIPDLSLRPLKVGLGLVVGLIFGGVAAFLREMGTQSVRRREDLEGVLHVRGLAAIPHANGNGGAPGRRYLPLSSRRTSGAHSVAANGNGSSSALVTLARTSSPGAEAFRILGANLTAGGAGTGPRMFVVTSAMPGEGKTVTAVNLAVICARNGMRVLLVDGDLRHGQLHRLFDVPQEPGFTDLLASDAPAEVAARATSEERLWLLVRGSALDNPAQALTGASARTVLAALAGYFDLLIVDTPPVLAVADAAILAAQADGVILVVRAGQVSLAAARQTHDRLVSVGATILGAVLNDPSGQAPRSANEYGYFDQYAGAQYVDTQQVDSYIATTRLADSYRPDAAPVMDMRIETRPVVEPPAGAGPGAAPPAGAPPARDTNTLDA